MRVIEVMKCAYEIQNDLWTDFVTLTIFLNVG